MALRSLNPMQTMEESEEGLGGNKEVKASPNFIYPKPADVIPHVARVVTCGRCVTYRLSHRRLTVNV